MGCQATRFSPANFVVLLFFRCIRKWQMFFLDGPGLSRTSGKPIPNYTRRKKLGKNAGRRLVLQVVAQSDVILR